MNDETRADQNSNRPVEPNAQASKKPANLPLRPAGTIHSDPDDLALFALQLLSAEESAVIAAHLEGCGDCHAEFARLQGDLGVYAYTVEMHPAPAGALPRLLRQVAREKKIVPIVQPGATGSRESASLVASGQRRSSTAGVLLGWSGWAVAAGLALATTFLYRDRNALRSTVASLDRDREALSGATAGQSARIATLAHEDARLAADDAKARRIMEALTDPKAVRVTLSPKPLPKGVPTGRATYNAQKGTLIFLASNLDPLQQYKTYELWLLPADGSASIPAGTFQPDSQGNASVIMPTLPKGIAAKGFGVTIENEGGSQIPTKPILIAGF